MVLTLSDSVVQSYILYSAILALKLLAMSMLTAKHRMSKKVFANPEDVAFGNGKIKYDDEDVERVRRAHRNDLENIPAFWILGALYLTTGPIGIWATMLFRCFAISRMCHTFFYLSPLGKGRGLGFSVAYFINLYMGVHVVLHYMSAM